MIISDIIVVVHESGDTMDANYFLKNVSISLSEAQELCALYSPLKTNQDLYSCLASVLAGNTYTYDIKSMPREIYHSLLYQYYPNEAAIKAAFSNQFFLNSKKHVTIYELNAGSSRVDMCKINGTSTAYEIKTDFDNFNRLEKQLSDYMQLFDRVYVICSENRIEDIQKYLPDNVGIYTYRQTQRNNYRFQEIKRPSCENMLNPAFQLQLLSKSALSKYCNDNTLSDRSDMEADILENYKPSMINKVFKQCIKEKYEKRWSFIYENQSSILDLDYQWFFKNEISPELIYQ